MSVIQFFLAKLYGTRRGNNWHEGFQYKANGKTKLWSSESEGTNKSDVNSDSHHVIQTLINKIDIRGNAVTSFDVVQSKKNKIKRHH